MPALGRRSAQGLGPLQGFELSAAALKTDRRHAGRFFDLGWIKRNVPIVEVAEKLGVERRGRSSAICPFHPDSEPSLSFHHNRFTCHAASCGRRGDALDLAAGLRGGIRLGLDWIAARWPVPERDNEQRTGRGWELGRVGAGGHGTDLVVRSRLLGVLPTYAARVLFAAVGLADPLSGKFTIAHAGLAAFSGQGRQQVSRGKSLLRAVGLLSWTRAEEGAVGFRSLLKYQLHVDASTCRDAVRRLVEKQAGAPRRARVAGRFSTMRNIITVPAAVTSFSPAVPAAVTRTDQGNGAGPKVDVGESEAVGAVEGVENDAGVGSKNGSGVKLIPRPVGFDTPRVNLKLPEGALRRGRRMRGRPIFPGGVL